MEVNLKNILIQVTTGVAAPAVAFAAAKYALVNPVFAAGTAAVLVARKILIDFLPEAKEGSLLAGRVKLLPELLSLIAIIGLNLYVQPSLNKAAAIIGVAYVAYKIVTILVTALFPQPPTAPQGLGKATSDRVETARKTGRSLKKKGTPGAGSSSLMHTPVSRAPMNGGMSIGVAAGAFPKGKRAVAQPGSEGVDNSPLPPFEQRASRFSVVDTTPAGTPQGGPKAPSGGARTRYHNKPNGAAEPAAQVPASTSTEKNVFLTPVKPGAPGSSEPTTPSSTAAPSPVSAAVPLLVVTSPTNGSPESVAASPATSAGNGEPGATPATTSKTTVV